MKFVKILLFITFSTYLEAVFIKDSETPLTYTEVKAETVETKTEEIEKQDVHREESEDLEALHFQLEQEANEDDENLEEIDGGRTTRVSCDLFSFTSKWITPNHSVCAARCLAMNLKGYKYKGGTCKNGVCHCRK